MAWLLNRDIEEAVGGLVWQHAAWNSRIVTFDAS